MFKPLAMGINNRLGVDAYVPILTQNFELRIYGLDGQADTEFSEVLTLSTNDIGAISEEQDVITVHYANGVMKFPNKVSFADVDWNLNCYAEPDTLTALRKWRAQVFNPATEEMGVPTEYMRTGYLIRYDGKGNVKDVIKLPGIWPGAISNGEYNQEGGLVKVSVSLKVSKSIYLTREEFMQ